MDSIGGKGLHKDEKGYLHNDYGEVWGYCRVSTKEQNIDRQEELGIYEVAPEDFAVAEFVDSSKLELQRIVREGLDLLRKENS